MEPSCSHTDDRITLQTQPKRSNSRLSSSSSQRAKMVKLRLEQLAKDLCLIGDRRSVWSLLPINLLIAIFKLLSVYDRARCSCVCKHWKTVYHMPDLWHQFVFEFHQTTTMSKSTPIMLIRQVCTQTICLCIDTTHVMSHSQKNGIWGQRRQMIGR